MKLLPLFIRHKIKFLEFFSIYLLKVMYVRWKECISVIFSLDESDIENIDESEGLSVDFSSSDDENIFFMLS